MLTKKKSSMKNMAIPACVALVSLFLPSSSSPSDEKSNSTTSSSWYARNFYYATLSVDQLMDGLTQAELDQLDPSDPRYVEGNSKSKKKPKTGGD
jgi:hypothetical protein